MPFVQVYLIEGRSEKQKSEVITRVTASICEALGSPAESVRVWIHDVPNTNWGIGGQTAKSLGR